MNHNTLKIDFSRYLGLLVLLVLPTFSAFPIKPVHSSAPAIVLTCTPPSPTRTGQVPGANTYSWSAVSGATQYAAYWVRKSDGATGQITYTTATSVTFSGLPAGDYAFCFATVCSGSVSDFVIIEDVIIVGY